MAAASVDIDTLLAPPPPPVDTEAEARAVLEADLAVTAEVREALAEAISEVEARGAAAAAAR